MRTLAVCMLAVAAYAVYGGIVAGTDIDLAKGIVAAVMLAMPAMLAFIK